MTLPMGWSERCTCKQNGRLVRDHQGVIYQIIFDGKCSICMKPVQGVSGSGQAIFLPDDLSDEEE